MTVKFESPCIWARPYTVNFFPSYTVKLEYSTHARHCHSHSIAQVGTLTSRLLSLSVKFFSYPKNCTPRASARQTHAYTVHDCRTCACCSTVIYSHLHTKWVLFILYSIRINNIVLRIVQYFLTGESFMQFVRYILYTF